MCRAFRVFLTGVWAYIDDVDGVKVAVHGGGENVRAARGCKGNACPSEG